MKLIAFVLVTLSVILGSLASSTAYLVRLQGATPESLASLKLGSPAGSYDPETADQEFLDRLNRVREELDAEQQAVANPLKPPSSQPVIADAPPVITEPTGEAVLGSRELVSPIGRTGDRLTPDLIAILSDTGVTYVKVSEFGFSRWPHAWLFALSCAGLLIGAWIVRKAQQRDLMSSESAATKPDAEAADAETIFARLSGRLRTLEEELAGMDDEEARLDAILLHIGLIQRDDVPGFTANRPKLINRLSLAGYAELMDSFAAMERQLNRAWSAAADSHLPESEACLRNAQPLLIETLHKLERQDSQAG